MTTDHFPLMEQNAAVLDVLLLSFFKLVDRKKSPETIGKGLSNQKNI